MPSYDYGCQDCEELFEVQRSFADAQLPATCPECGSARTQKKLSPISFISTGGSASPRVSDSTSLPVSIGGCGCSGCSCGLN